jgi:hypothetical protein
LINVVMGFLFTLRFDRLNTQGHAGTEPVPVELDRYLVDLLVLSDHG